ncbi:MAG: hypothetical protein U0573_04150 [Phycisphaerales bacterium]|nr:hypothetical protein [Planctomycetota bacterium]
MTHRLTRQAFAKINLALAVSRPEHALREDGSSNPRAGWHRISSLFACVTLRDTLTLQVAPETRFRRAWADDAPRQTPFDWPVEKDLVYRAHQALCRRVGKLLPVVAEIEKRIPAGGGLGGGSSDAAAMLDGLNDLFALGLPTQELAKVGSELGSDVAFFLDRPGKVARPALVEGFGDEIQRRAYLSGDVVLIMPQCSCPTPLVYRAFDSWLSGQPGFVFRSSEVGRLFRSDSPAHSLTLFNDLAVPAAIVSPVVGEMQRRAEAVHSPVHVTGSGSTLFAIVETGKGGELASRLKSALGSGAAVLSARFAEEQGNPDVQ